MNDKVRILFLAANPIDAGNRLRLDEEVREIDQKIRQGTLRDRFDLVSEWAVRTGDLQEALLRHKPDIVHFSGYGHVGGAIILEDQSGNSKVIDKQAFGDLFRILKDNIRVVVLNACFAKGQANELVETIDFTIGMNAAIEEKAAIVFASYFYQSLAFGCSVKKAFDLAVNQLDLEGIKGADVPELLVRRGADASKSRLVKKSRGAQTSDADPDEPVDEPERRQSRLASLSWLFAILAASLLAIALRRFFGGDGGWADVVSTIGQPILITLAIILAALVIISLILPTNPLVEKAARLLGLRTGMKPRTMAIITGTGLVIALGLWFSLPAFAHIYNERGYRHYQSGDPANARQSYERALRLEPGYAQAHYNLALVDEDLHDENAVNEYLLAIKYNSHMYPAYNNLARLYLLRGKDNDYSEALNILNQAWSLSPQDPGIQYSLNKNTGWADYALGDFQQAEDYLRRAISLRNDGASAHCLLAWVLRDQDKPGVTQECFDCIRFAPGEKDVESKWVSDANKVLDKRAH